jgi:16S rRNA (cytosine1402-N4)-methyltransferase
VTLHQPVLLEPVLQKFLEMDSLPKTLWDGTFGRGGHCRAFLQRMPDCQITASDCDSEAIAFGEENFKEEINSKRLRLLLGNYLDIAKQFSNDGVKFDAVFLDLGVSSPQLDDADRGFSLYNDGPLDMRMDQSKALTAREIVNSWNADDLEKIFVDYGEAKRAQRVADRIIHERAKKEFETTKSLADVIARVEGWRRKGHHPATQYFQALRIAVNDELRIVEEVLPTLIHLLAPKGRLQVITFHSLEDRITKYKLKESTEFGRLVNKKVIKPTWDEQKDNKRARSAKLRVFERGE